MDDIFDRWINTGQIFQTDIIPIMLEYDSLYNDGSLGAKECEMLLQFLQIMPHVSLAEFINNCLKKIALKKDGDLVELFDKNGKLLRRFWYKT